VKSDDDKAVIKDAFSQANAMLLAVADEKNGILPWLKKFW
jgi:hypothetical protein